MGITSRGFITFDPALDGTKTGADYITKDSKENMELLDTQLTTLEEKITNKLKLNNESIQNVNMTLSPNGDSVTSVEVKSIGLPKLYKKSKANSGEWIEIAYTEARDLTNYSYKFMY